MPCLARPCLACLALPRPALPCPACLAKLGPASPASPCHAAPCQASPCQACRVLHLSRERHRSLVDGAPIVPMHQRLDLLAPSGRHDAPAYRSADRRLPPAVRPLDDRRQRLLARLAVTSGDVLEAPADVRPTRTRRRVPRTDLPCRRLALSVVLHVVPPAFLGCAARASWRAR